MFLSSMSNLLCKVIHSSGDTIEFVFCFVYFFPFLFFFFLRQWFNNDFIHYKKQEKMGPRDMVDLVDNVMLQLT